MKKWILIFTALFSLTSFAGAVSDEDLNLVNEYLTELAEVESPITGIDIELTAADKDELTGLLENVTAEVSYVELVKAKAYLNLDSSTVIDLSAFGYAKEVYREFDPEISDDEFLQVIEDIKNLTANSVKKIEELAASDSYLDVEVEFSDSSSGFGFKFSASPKSIGESEFNSISVNAFYNPNTDKLSFGFSFDGASSSDELNQSRVYLSDIFNTLLKKETPAQSDINALIDSVTASYERVAGQLANYIGAIF